MRLWPGCGVLSGFGIARRSPLPVPALLTMQNTIEDSAVMLKTKELCQVILDQPDLQAHRRCIAAFLEDAGARAQYDAVVAKGQVIHEKQHRAQTLTGEELADFERHRDALLKNPVARAFIDAQEEMHRVQQSIQQYVSKTLDLGRLPRPEDLECCDHEGCGCHQ